jgi:hypothetical protein
MKAPPRTEIVIGLVSAVGTNLRDVAEALGKYLREDYGYHPDPLKVSDWLDKLNLDQALAETPQYAHILTRMEARTEARAKYGKDARSTRDILHQ